MSELDTRLPAVTDTLLRSLREHVIDESQSLAGLLRKCLLLGAETGSDALRAWARNELNGYRDEDELPEYRQLVGVPISIDTLSGPNWARGQIIDRLQIPEEARQYVPETIPLRQGVDELERTASQDSVRFTSPGLAVAQSIWTQQLGMFQSVEGIRYVMSGSAFVGILGEIRTALIDMVAELTASTPLSELPSKAQVDDAVTRYVGDVYNTTIQGATGPLAIGDGAKAKSDGLSVGEVLQLLDGLNAVVEMHCPEGEDEILEAVAELRAELASEQPDTGEVVKKAGRLRTLVGKIGGATLVASTEGAVGSIVQLAMSGALG